MNWRKDFHAFGPNARDAKGALIKTFFVQAEIAQYFICAKKRKKMFKMCLNLMKNFLLFFNSISLYFSIFSIIRIDATFGTLVTALDSQSCGLVFDRLFGSLESPVSLLRKTFDTP